MATSICIKCGKNSFILVEVEQRKSRLRYNLLRCANCGNVVGMPENFGLEDLLSGRNEVIDSLIKKVNHLDSR